MRPFAWLRLLLPALCAGALPACLTAPYAQPQAQRPYSAQAMRSASNSPWPAPRVSRATPTSAAPPDRAAAAEPAPKNLPPAGPANDESLVVGRDLPGLLPPAFGPSSTSAPPPDEAPHTAGKPGPTLQAAGAASLVPGMTALAAAPQRLPPSITGEGSPLLAALNSFLQEKPNQAAKELANVDASTRDILMTLLPLTVRVSEGGASSTDPKDVAVVVDQLQGLLWLLRPKAALVMDKFCFCREIRRFGVFEAFDGRPAFQPGEMVQVYAEIRNVASRPHRSARGDYRTHLRSALDIRRATGESAWQAPQFFDKPDDTATPQHDYFQHYRFQMPSLEPGHYVLRLEVLDVPTGRKVEQQMEFTIGPAGKTARSE